MSVSARERAAYRADEKHGHTLLTQQERDRLIKAHLPPVYDSVTTTASSTTHRRSRIGARRFLRNQIHALVFIILHAFFSLYIRLRQALHVVSYRISSVVYYHHGTPQYIKKDLLGVEKKPQHLSVVLRAERSHRPKADLARLIDETADMATWCICAGIPMLSVYEKSGVLKNHMPRVYEAALQKFTFYFGGEYPGLTVTSPHKDSLSSTTFNSAGDHLKLHLISSQDGKESMVDLTRTLAEMSQKGKLSPQDISMELIDAELSEGIMPEPELLILFSPYVELEGYPPWQIRLTEIFCLQDNEAFGYQVFLKALRRYASAQFRRGK